MTKFKSWFLIVILCVKISKTIESKTDRSIPHHSSAPACLQITFMITNTSHKIKYFTQKNYKQFLDTIQFHRLSCSCGRSGCLIKHAYYERRVKTPDGCITLRILRVICKHCGKTHAVFPEWIVPYSQILLKDHLKIIQTYLSQGSFEQVMMSNLYIDESNIRYIIRQYLRYWKERITAFAFVLDDTISFHCLKTLKRQFMQIKCIQNILSV